jgi:hypothetical protein
LKTIPTELKTLRSLPEQFGQVVRASSLNDWWISNVWAQSVHA